LEEITEASGLDLTWATESYDCSTYDAFEIVQVDPVPREKKPATVLALSPSGAPRPTASRNADAVDRGEVTPTGRVRVVRPIPTLHGGDSPRIPPNDLVPRVLLTEFPNVAALKHLVLPSLLKTETLSV
jgi:hypothetical protein